MATDTLVNKNNGGILLDRFSFAFCKNRDLDFAPSDIRKLCELYREDVTLPHDIALSVSEHKTPEQLYFAQNVLQLQDFEDIHSFYFAEFDAECGYKKMILNRVDTFADVYLNGELVLSCDNAFISFEQKVLLKERNSIVIHIKPAVLEAKKIKLSPNYWALRYNGGGQGIRKPAHTFGWDIIPRNTLGGIFDSVRFEAYKTDYIDEIYFSTLSVDRKNESAHVLLCGSFEVEGDFFKDYEFEIDMSCGESNLHYKNRLWSNMFRERFDITDCKLWTVKNFGTPYLYDLTVKLYRLGELVDERKQKVGIRTIELVKENRDDENGGCFDFILNGERVFVKGVNWIPVDTLYSKTPEKMQKHLDLLNESNSNMVRVWGGGIYEPESFYEFCDENGIMVWQDFMMACGVYPQNDEFLEAIRKEASQIVIRLRNHASIALWSGDNECDAFLLFRNKAKTDPNNNLITRKVLPEVIYRDDPTRAFLTSSPFVDDTTFKTGVMSENHIWESRHDFRGEDYQKYKVSFVSETGFHALPSRSSLERFISEENMSNIRSDDHLVHFTSPTVENSYYAFRMDFIPQPIVGMFGSVPEQLGDTVYESQIAQAEAVKYFIERLRIRKERKGGIIYWNLIDAWPSVSESTVDYYYHKKLSYYYMERSYRDVAVMMDREKDGRVIARALNDTLNDVHISYTISEVTSNTVIAQGECTLTANGAADLWTGEPIADGYYRLEWILNGETFVNHYAVNMRNIKLEDYERGLLKCGMDIKELFGSR